MAVAIRIAMVIPSHVISNALFQFIQDSVPSISSQFLLYARLIDIGDDLAFHIPLDAMNYVVAVTA